MRRRLLGVLGAALVAVPAGCGGGGDRELVGYTRDPAPQVASVALPDVSRGSKPFEFRAADDGILVVYFGFTNCPDVCPTTMSDLGRAIDELGDEAERVSVAMVTVDPERDTDVLAEYVDSFVPGGHAIATEDVALLRDVAEAFGTSFDVTTAPDGKVEVTHSSYLFAVDDTGTLILTWPFGTAVDDLAADLRQLLDDAA
jgi:protein SCO1/2